MLVMFRVKNFTSFRGEVVLDVRAGNYKQHPEHVLTTAKGQKILKTVAVYGANAAGKSNLVRAMYFFERYIFRQFISKKDKVDFEQYANDTRLMENEPFLLSDGIDPETEFEIVFECQGKQHQYGFVLQDDAVINEWYEMDGIKVFERKGERIIFGSRYKQSLQDYRKVPTNRLYLAVLDYFLPDHERGILLDSFETFFQKEYIVFHSFYLEPTIKRAYPLYSPLWDLAVNEEIRDKVLELVKAADLSIIGLAPKEEKISDTETGKSHTLKTIETLHPVYDTQGQAVGQKAFELDFESSGTRHFMQYAERFVTVIEQGGVFIVDELSSHLHPMLTKLIVDLFQSPANQKAQLIFTTHDVSLLNREQFRRDEIAFVDKDSYGVSSLYSLSDLKIREDASYRKEYLQGKYGAIPILQDMGGVGTET